MKRLPVAITHLGKSQRILMTFGIALVAVLGHALVSAHSNSDDSAFTELSICGSSGTTLCKVGERGPGGGFIFFVDNQDIYAGFNYLEAAPTDSSTSIAWCNVFSNFGLSGSETSVVGRGQANTNAMLAGCSSGAAVSADQYFTASKTDWFLPSLDEAILMHNNLVPVDIGDFTTGGHWSSNEYVASYSRSEGGTSAAHYYEWDDTLYVRPIRSF